MNGSIEWVCSFCGETYGRRPEGNEFSTWHMGTCDCCGDENVPVTQPRDFGGIDPGVREYE